MEVAIVAVGRLRSGPEADLCGRYLDRAATTGRGLGLQQFRTHEVRESRAQEPSARKAEEAGQIRALVGARRFICLDERGEDISSAELAEWLRRQADAGTAWAAFVIGGADGLDPGIYQLAERTVAFGRQTWPHQLARVMLAEQLYRATTILARHPYHRA